MMEYGRDNAMAALRNGSMDLHLDVAAGTVIPDYNMEFQCLKLFESELVFCIPPDHPLAEKECLTLEEIKDEPLVLRRSGSYSAYSNLYRIFRSMGYTPNVRFYSNIIATIRSMIINHLAYTLIMKNTLGDGITILEKPFHPSQVYTCWLQWDKRVQHDKIFYDVLDHIRNMDKSFFNP